MPGPGAPVSGCSGLNPVPPRINAVFVTPMTPTWLLAVSTRGAPVLLDPPAPLVPAVPKRSPPSPPLPPAPAAPAADRGRARPPPPPPPPPRGAAPACPPPPPPPPAPAVAEQEAALPA